mmetsp:Transcript_44061/g.101856  ORF Transcript_44061/g.101856 Transcript_44061/m.101856 type:complete len:362 (-) Transcript_44061:554-1639(-)
MQPFSAACQLKSFSLHGQPLSHSHESTSTSSPVIAATVVSMSHLSHHLPLALFHCSTLSGTSPAPTARSRSASCGHVLVVLRLRSGAVETPAAGVRDRPAAGADGCAMAVGRAGRAANIGKGVGGAAGASRVPCARACPRNSPCSPDCLRGLPDSCLPDSCARTPACDLGSARLLWSAREPTLRLALVTVSAWTASAASAAVSGVSGGLGGSGLMPPASTCRGRLAAGAAPSAESSSPPEPERSSEAGCSPEMSITSVPPPIPSSFSFSGSAGALSHHQHRTTELPVSILNSYALGCAHNVHSSRATPSRAATSIALRRRPSGLSMETMCSSKACGNPPSCCAPGKELAAAALVCGLSMWS